MLLVVGHREILVQGGIQVGKSRRSEAPALQGAEETCRHACRRRLVCSLVHPVVQRSRAASEVWTLSGRIGPIEVAKGRCDAGVVNAKKGSAHDAGLVGKDTSQLPPAH